MYLPWVPQQRRTQTAGGILALTHHPLSLPRVRGQGTKVKADRVHKLRLEEPSERSSTLQVSKETENGCKGAECQVLHVHANLLWKISWLKHVWASAWILQEEITLEDQQLLSFGKVYNAIHKQQMNTPNSSRHKHIPCKVIHWSCATVPPCKVVLFGTEWSV